MNKKFLGLIILFIMAVIFIRPNWAFLQEKNTKISPIKNNINVELYRNNPAKYFEILKEKQKANASNISLVIKFKHLKEEFYKKDLFRKTVTITEKEQSHMITKKDMIYYYQEIDGNYSKYAIKMKQSKNTKVNYDTIAHILPTPKEDLELYKYKYSKFYPRFNRSCAVWHYKTNRGISEFCFDEELGIRYYWKTYFPQTKTEYVVHEVEDIKIGQNTNETFNVPKHYKFIINMSPVMGIIENMVANALKKQTGV